MNWAYAIGGLLIVAYLWKGKNIRAAVSMTGEGWDRLHPEVQQKAQNILRDAQAAGLNVGIFEGYRTRERQLEVMKKGASWVGETDSSYHRWGLAVDFVFFDSLGRWSWLPTENGKPDPRWYTLGEIIEKNGMQWGGRWEDFDGPHAQYKIMNIAQLKSVYGTPEALSWA